MKWTRTCDPCSSLHLPRTTGHVTVREAGPDGSCCMRLRSWVEIEQDSALREAVVWPTLKYLDRAVFNLTFFFHGDVSRLTDIVQQRLVLTRMQDIQACLTAIQDDPELQIVVWCDRLVCIGNEFMSMTAECSPHVCFPAHRASKTTSTRVMMPTKPLATAMWWCTYG